MYVYPKRLQTEIVPGVTSPQNVLLPTIIPERGSLGGNYHQGENALGPKFLLFVEHIFWRQTDSGPSTLIRSLNLTQTEKTHRSMVSPPDPPPIRPCAPSSRPNIEAIASCFLPRVDQNCRDITRKMSAHPFVLLDWKVLFRVGKLAGRV